MKFNTQVCTTREQSERLLALGLKKDTADCRWVGLVKDAKGNDIPKKKQVWFTKTREDERAMVCGFMRYDYIPAWSLHRLVSMCADNNFLSSNQISLYNFSTYDRAIDLAEYLISHNHFNKQYLNQDL